jgi:hypothetical protein
LEEEVEKAKVKAAEREKKINEERAAAKAA